MVSFYVSCIMLFGGDMGARTDIELIYISVGGVLGAVVQATMFGELANLVYMLNKDQLIL